MNPDSSAGPNHLNPSIANLLTDSQNDPPPVNFNPQPPTAVAGPNLGSLNGSSLNSLLNAVPQLPAVPTPFLPTPSCAPDLSVAGQQLLNPLQNEASGPIQESAGNEVKKAVGDEDEIDDATGKKKRGRPRIHPENAKAKRTGVRGRPRSETSQRALKEAARNQALRDDSNSVSTQLDHPIDAMSATDDAETTAPSENHQDTNAASIKMEPPSRISTPVNGAQNDISLSAEIKETNSVKRKAIERSSTPDVKPKHKKIKKEDGDLSKKSDQESAPLKSKPHSSSTTPSISAVSSPVIKLEDASLPSLAKKKRGDGSRKAKKPPTSLNGHSYELEDEGEVYCICRRGDNGEWMIACDSCDDWFHGSCVNLTEKGSSIVVKYVCPRCTESGKSVSIYKRRCRLPSCDLPVEYEDMEDGGQESRPKSKYCSRQHGLEFFRLLVDKIQDQQALDPHVVTAPQLVTLMNNCKTVTSFHRLGTKFPPSKTLPSEEDIEKSFSKSDQDIVTALQKQIDELEEKLKYNDYRSQFVQQCKERAKLIGEELAREEEADQEADDADQAEESKPAKSAKSNAKKKKQQKSKKDICGYNSKLTLGEDKWKVFIISEDGQKALTADPQQQSQQNRELTCLVDKRKCPRHYGWQSLHLESARDLARNYKVEQERIKTQMAELYYKEQVRIMTKSSTAENRTVAC